MQRRHVPMLTTSTHLEISATKSSKRRTTKPSTKASRSCTCSAESKVQRVRQQCSSTGKPLASAFSRSSAQRCGETPACSQPRCIAPPWSPAAMAPASKDSVPASASGRLAQTLALFEAMATACASVRRFHTFRTPESSWRSASSCPLMNFTCVARRRAATSSATLAGPPSQLSSSSVDKGRKGRLTGSMEHSWKTESHIATKRRNSVASDWPLGARSLDTFCRKRWKSRRLASKERSANVAWASMDFAMHASISATVSW
mmetsp:Transcript_94338/g.250547  ORF Transcript_94338/g.250547 Transcript_94338/m.250547 type:complete len:260 (-) Transcript_94338:509-1288(-)